MENKHVHALVTGASRGIGRSITECLLNSGARVIGTAVRSSFPREFNDHDQFVGVHVDLASLHEVESILRPLIETDDGPNVIVNNAGISEDVKFDASEDDWNDNWERTLAINLTSPVRLSRWALNYWKKHDVEGILINIASRAAYRGDTASYAPYAASKGGLVAFTKTAARGFGKNNIAAYSIAPGFIDTDMARQTIPVYGEEYLMRGIVMPELTPPSEVGELVAWLAGGKVRHLTGSTFHINGGSYMI
ncbi:MAG TPA: SDR family oxidoreductase [Balneolales bacterium]|nr:SDR family oxidoreductase [Balneolales bacterium]